MQEEPYIINKKRTVRKVYKGRIIAVALIVCFIVIVGAIWFSRENGKLKLVEREYSFVTVGQYDSLADASARAGAVIQAGGAGYILGQSQYRVMAACYTSEEDAAKVCDRLSESGETASVYVAVRSEMSVSRPDKNAEIAARVMTYPDEIFDTLYEISIKTDTNEISEEAARYGLLKMSVSVSAQKAECAELGGEIGKYVENILSKIADSLDALTDANQNFPQAIKYTLCEIADIICFSDAKILS